MSNTQRYPWNLYLINNVKDFFDLLGLKVFIYLCYPAVEKHVLFCRETTIENYQFLIL